MTDSLQRARKEIAQTESPSAMPKQSDQSATDGTTSHESDFLDIQRAGLEALLGLSRAVVSAAESDVEERFQRARASAQLTLQSRLREIENRTQTELAAVEQSQAQQTPSIQSQYESAVAALAEQSKSAIKRVAANSQEMESEVKSQLQNQFLMVDTAAQANCERLRQERLIAEKQAAQEFKNLDLLQTRAIHQLER
jgi:hypothetical protein